MVDSTNKVDNILKLFQEETELKNVKPLMRIADLQHNREADMQSAFAPGSTIVLCCSARIPSMEMAMLLAADASGGENRAGLFANAGDVVLVSKSINASELEKMLEKAGADASRCFVFRDPEDVHLDNAEIKEQMRKQPTLVVMDQLQSFLKPLGAGLKSELDDFAEFVKCTNSIAILVAVGQQAASKIHHLDPATTQFYVLDALLHEDEIRVTIYGNPIGGQLVYKLDTAKKTVKSVRFSS